MQAQSFTSGSQLTVFRLMAVVSMSFALSMALGCGADSGSEDSDGSTSNSEGDSGNQTSSTGSSSSGEVDPATISLTVSSKEALEERVAELNGKVVLLDFWATWCGPCIKKLPQVTEWNEQYGEEGLHVISVCIGDPADTEKLELAKQILATKAAPLEHHIGDYDDDQTALDTFEMVNVPHYRLYNREGNMVGSFDGMPEDLEEQIQALLE